jgi:hypothetical protein
MVDERSCCHSQERKDVQSQTPMSCCRRRQPVSVLVVPLTYHGFFDDVRAPVDGAVRERSRLDSAASGARVLRPLGRAEGSLAG